MNPLVIEIKEQEQPSGASLLTIEGPINTGFIGTQYDDRKISLSFIRPEGHAGSELILTFRFPSGKEYSENIYTKNIYLLRQRCTMEPSFIMGVTLVSASNVLESSNTLNYFLRPFNIADSLAPNLYLRSAVTTRANKVPQIWESADGEFVYFSQKDNIAKVLTLDIQEVANEVTPIVAEQVVPIVLSQVAEEVIPDVIEQVTPIVVEQVVPIILEDVADDIVPMVITQVVPLIYANFWGVF